MDQPKVTIAVVPRERFNMTAYSLESIYRETHYPFKMIYVDGGSPNHVRNYLQIQAQKKGFELIRTDHYLSPNQARNLALKNLDTRYVLFIDNDVVVTPGWLAALVQCAEETGAWVVGPVYCIGQPEFQTIHMAGGMAHIVDDHGQRDLNEQHRFIGKPWDGVRDQLHREPTELVEFHSILIQTEVFGTIGSLDENLLSSPEHIDLCLLVKQAGGTICFEPRSLVNYLSPPPLARSDLSFFMLRWSDEWNRKSLEHFRKKWELADNSTFLTRHYDWLTGHRQQITLAPMQTGLRNLVGWRLGSWLGSQLLARAEKSFNNWWVSHSSKTRVAGQTAK